MRGPGQMWVLSMKPDVRPCLLGWLACVLPRIRISDGVDPSARRNMWAGKCDDPEWGWGFQRCGKCCYIFFRQVGLTREYQNESGMTNSFNFTDARAVGSLSVGWTDMICWAAWKDGPEHGRRKRRKGAAERGACARTESILLAPNST